MKTPTKRMCEEIRKKVKSRVTADPEFKTIDEVIDYSVLTFYNQLKKERYL